MDLVKSKFGVWRKRFGQWEEVGESRTPGETKVGWVWLTSKSGGLVGGPYLRKAGLTRAKNRATALAFAILGQSCRSNEALLEFLANFPVTQVRFHHYSYMHITFEGIDREFSLYAYWCFPQELAYQAINFPKPVRFKEINDLHILFSNGRKIKLDQSRMAGRRMVFSTR